MRLCIFGRDDDALTAHTAARARALGHSALTVPLGQMVGGAPVAFDGGSWMFGGEELEQQDAFVVRQYPAPHALLADPGATATAAAWFALGTQQGERSSFALSLLMDLERLGKPMVNPVLTTAPFDHKPLQLATLQRAGIPIPRTLVTNVPDAARAFVDDVGPAICKPTAGGAEARLVDDGVRARLEEIRAAPVIFQERVSGPDLRVTVVGDAVVSAVEIESDTLDYRSGAAYRSGDARYTTRALPADVVALCLRTARLLGHVLSGVDLKARADGSFVVLEANSAPVYLDIEQKTGAPITDAILGWLADRSGR